MHTDSEKTVTMANEFSSPKRKRVDDEIASHLQTSIVPRFPNPQPDHDGGGDSPRTMVAGRFQDLNLEHYISNQHSHSPTRENKRFAQSYEERGSDSLRQNRNLEHQTDGISERNAFIRPPDAAFTFEHSAQLAPPQEDKRPKSPSLSGEISDQYWHESEITGHDPDDPNDDGYGINGIGFKPTPAIAQARSQKRKQQLAEYRSREAKEARQKRSERRRGGSGESSSAVAMAEELSKAKVRFESG
jgi:hypothetical protein